ncbi:Na(+)-translocating NADH-quinone reductase subunit C [Shewanella sp.]|nr:Na(+)-translocating NADH-quinone reductase subunit C [Shewanella sp.]
MAIKKDSFLGTMIFTVILCLLCSFMITGTAEVLKERKLVKKRTELMRNVLIAANVDFNEQTDLAALFAKDVKPLLITLKSGEVVNGDSVMDFDSRMASINPDSSIKLKRKQDKAKIKTRANQVRVFKVFDDSGKLTSVVLPIYGKGLWSMLYGFVALKADFNTIENVVFYEHGETPGIGDFLNDTQWTAQWHGKQIFNSQGKVAFKVVKGGAKAGDIHGIDAVSGATMTGRGVQRSIQFWFGHDGFEVFIKKLKASEV